MSQNNHRHILLRALSILLILTIYSCKSETKAIERKPVQKIEKETALLRHVVLFKFKEDTTTEQITAVENAFSALPRKIEEIVSYEWGINNSPEGLDKGFTHCFFLTFKSEEDRAAYLPHPDHMAFVALASPFFEDVLVVDYWIK